MTIPVAFPKISATPYLDFAALGLVKRPTVVHIPITHQSLHATSRDDAFSIEAAENRRSGRESREVRAVTVENPSAKPVLVLGANAEQRDRRKVHDVKHYQMTSPSDCAVFNFCLYRPPQNPPKLRSLSEKPIFRWLSLTFRNQSSDLRSWFTGRDGSGN